MSNQTVIIIMLMVTISQISSICRHYNSYIWHIYDMCEKNYKYY